MMKTTFKVSLTVICCLLFNCANSQMKFGVVAYQYYKNSDGKRNINYDIRKFNYNSADEAKASVDIWYKKDEKKDSEIFYEIVTDDLGADNRANTYYSGSFSAIVRNKDGQERTLEDVKYCYYKTELDLKEAIVAGILATDRIVEPVKFTISKCTP